MANEEYTLSFAVAGLSGPVFWLHLPPTVRVFAGTQHADFQAAPGVNWQMFSWTFTATTTGPTSLEFQSLSGPVNLDTITFISTRDIPEPSRSLSGFRNFSITPGNVEINSLH